MHEEIGRGVRGDMLLAGHDDDPAVWQGHSNGFDGRFEEVTAEQEQ